MQGIENSIAYLQSFQVLNDSEIERLISCFEFKTLTKGDFYIQEGKVGKDVGFVVSGLMRSFYYSSTEEEVTYCFNFENTFVAAYSSFLSQQPTRENIQALSEVQLLIVSREKIKELEEENVNWLRFFKLIAEEEYIRQEQRIFMLQCESAEKRYEDLVNNKPEYLQQIPLQYLASYLGITQRHLSRIRKSN